MSKQLDDNFWDAIIEALKIAEVSCVYFDMPSTHFKEMIDFINANLKGENHA